MAGRWLLILVCLLGSGIAAAANRVVEGHTASGARYRIEVPETWQPGGLLVLYQHGFTFEPADSRPGLSPLRETLLAEGYAVAATGFSQRGWALFHAVDDNRELLATFRDAIGAPGEVVPIGGSMGGLIALKVAEDADFRPLVRGVYSLCPTAAGARFWDWAVDLRLIYDAVCDGVSGGELPKGKAPYPWVLELGDIPKDLGLIVYNADLLRALAPIRQCTGIGLPPEQRSVPMTWRLQRIEQLTGLPDEAYLATSLGYATFALGDLVRAPDKLDGLSPFSNLGVRYGDGAIDARIARVAPDPMAALRLRWVSDFRGEIGTAKSVSLITDRDPIVVPANLAVLREHVPSAQLLSALVHESQPSHCGFTQAELVAGWETLRAWTAGGPAPSADTLQSSCVAAQQQGVDGACRLQPPHDVPAYDTQVRPRAPDEWPTPDARYSGSWQDPRRTGENITLEILDADTALVYFFTYPPVGDPADQVWLAGVGRIRPGGIVFDEIWQEQATGPARRWGRLWLAFIDCMNGRLRWEGPPGWGNRDVPIQRLNALHGLGCEPSTAVLRAPASGAWFDAAHDGTGLLVEQVGRRRARVYAFFGPGSPLLAGGWAFGLAQGDLANGVRTTLTRPHGPRFGAANDPAALRYDTSRLSIDLHLGCTTGRARLTDTLNGGTLDLRLERLTRLLGVPGCAP